MAMSKKFISVVIPVYNEEEALPELFKRLSAVLNNLEFNYEVIFINDGSYDSSLALLIQERKKNPEHIRIIDFNGNFGQHMAIIAGFKEAKGDIVITMDADMQNPPEEIPKIINEILKGHDVVGSIRQKRKDTFFRRTASYLVNKITNKITGLHLHDYGCMLRGYRKDIVEIINEASETTTFIPALAQKFAVNPVEIPVAHSERLKGSSKYNLFRLIRLNFDLMTGFSLVPLQAVTMMGIFISVVSFLFSCFLFIRRLIVGSEAEGVFTLLAINFFLMGITIFCMGIVGEYIGRIYQEVRHRPRYVIRKIYDADNLKNFEKENNNLNE